MKSFGLLQSFLVILIIGPISELLAADDKTARESCIKEVNLSAADANSVRGTAMISKLVQNNSESLKCFQLCYYKQLGFLDASGKTNGQKVLEYMSQASGITDTAKLVAALSGCESVNGASQCDKVYQFEKCALGKLGV
ncbi:uncharacterized protein LOC101450698 [Ceratitis capitata]|uniref:(Mediterranean fruit fly) hypothetical protein n=1 Tax=Ceratitis capitata TaxID=7213 RepID=W8AGN5_CERCA|nr:uncharacterized protein LOC101450698 [Ceratitis capitata]CAD7012643.1 unnamed protein product [Ceratitis capitata]